MTTIFLLYGATPDSLQALADHRQVRLLRNTIRQFDELADNNDGTHGVEPRLAIGGGGWVGLATDG
jgi:hypothetical protein